MPAEPTTAADSTAGPRGAEARNPLGLVALAGGVAAVLIGVLLGFVQAGTIGSRNYDLIGIISLAQAILTGLLGLAALAIGVVALLVRGASKPLASAGTALGAAVVVDVLASLLYPLIVQLTS